MKTFLTIGLLHKNFQIYGMGSQSHVHIYIISHAPDIDIDHNPTGMPSHKQQ